MAVPLTGTILSTPGAKVVGGLCLVAHSDQDA